MPEQPARAMLIVDDDEVFAQVLQRAMSRRGYRTRVAHDRRQAEDALSEQAFERVVLDLKLGRDSGLTLLPTVRKLNPGVEIVLLTGYSSIATAVEAIKLGAKNYLCKPANAEEILAAFDAEAGGSMPPADPPSVGRLEWEHIQKVLADNDGNISATARSLGMHRRTLQRKLNKRPRSN